MQHFNFNSVFSEVGTASPLDVPVEIVAGYAADRDGFPIEGAQPPLYANKSTPFTIEFSHEVPAMAFPTTGDFFEIDDLWKNCDVFAGRSTVRNLGRCFLFPVDDYFCREFVIDAACCNGKLFLQRHQDDAVLKQEEGYGIVFERAVTKGSHPEAHAYNQFVTYPIGDHHMFVRCEVDCVDSKTERSIGVTTKKIKRKKNGQGFYPLANPNYFQEHWLQLALCGASHLVIGHRDEGFTNTDSATITKLEVNSMEQLAVRGELDTRKQREIFASINAILTWIKRCFKAAKPTAGCLLEQAQIRFSVASGSKQLTFALVPPAQHVEFVSEDIVSMLRDASKK